MPLRWSQTLTKPPQKAFKALTFDLKDASLAAVFHSFLQRVNWLRNYTARSVFQRPRRDILFERLANKLHLLWIYI